jgi:uncharacterized lipoprotein YddW (UPF0748 family)
MNFQPSLIFSAEPVQQPAPFSGKRAILDGDIVLWTNREQLNRRLERIKEAGFNIYMPTVWQGRGTVWPSKYALWDTKLGDGPEKHFDPLRHCIQKAHQLGIEVHPWFTLTLRQEDIFPEFAMPGTPAKAFDVHNRHFRELMSNLIDEVVTNYDVDGINLDYVRAIDLCTNVNCRKEYSEKYGRDIERDARLFKIVPGMVQPLVEYQKSAVTAMVTEISERIRRRKPGILISADVFVGHAPLNQGQDSAVWANSGLVDVLLRMDYFRRLNVESMEATRRELNNPNAQTFLISNMSNPSEVGPEQAPFARDGKWLAETISMVLDRWPATGIAVYFYKYLTDEQIDALKNGPFRKEASP